MRYISILMLSTAIISAPVVWHLSERHFAAQKPDRSAEIAQEVDILRAELDALRARVDGLDARTALQSARRNERVEDRGPNPGASDSLKDAFAQVVLIANRREVNDGLTHATPDYLKEMLGLPREDLNDDCQEMTNPTLKEMLVLEDVGPIKVRLLRPAIISLKQIFANVQVFEPELYARIKSAGSLCVRQIRGSELRASAHAYGLALDINIDGVLDTLGDGKTQLGLTLLADFFKKEGWLWGAAFGREDSMHFEVSREKLEQWRRLGQI